MTNPLQGGKQLKAAEFAACAPSTALADVDIITIIVQSVVVAGAFCHRAFERLEPIAGKLARWVLRGESDGNAALLLDFGGGLHSTRIMAVSRCVEANPENAHRRAANRIAARPLAKSEKTNALDKPFPIARKSALCRLNHYRRRRINMG